MVGADGPRKFLKISLSRLAKKASSRTNKQKRKLFEGKYLATTMEKF